MLNYEPLIACLKEGIAKITDAMEKEVQETGNLILKRYVISMHRMQASIEELLLNREEAQASGAETSPADKDIYFRMCTFIADTIKRMENDDRTFVIRKYQNGMSNLLERAEALYLHPEQED